MYVYVCIWECIWEFPKIRRTLFCDIRILLLGHNIGVPFLRKPHIAVHMHVVFSLVYAYFMGIALRFAGQWGTMSSNMSQGVHFIPT